MDYNLVDYHKAFKWCVDNDIKIYPVVWDGSRCRIQVNYQGWKQTGEKIFDQKNKKENEAMYQLIRELYVNYYRKK